MSRAATRAVKLEQVAEVNPRRRQLDRDQDKPTSFVPMGAVDELRGCVRDKILRPYAEVMKGYCNFEDGDILFAKVSPCMQNGKHALVSGQPDGIGFGSTEFHVVRPGPEVCGRWLLHFLRQQAVLDAAAELFTGSVGLQRVPDSFLRSLSLSLPPLREQQDVAQALDRQLPIAQAAADTIREAMGLATDLHAAFFRSAFGPEPPLAAGATGSQALGKWRPLCTLARLESGHTPSRRHPEWWGGDIPWLALPDIRKLHGLIAHDTIEHTNDLGLVNSSARLLPVGTVCLCRDASIGFVTMLGRPMATSQHFCNWVCDPEKLDAEFLMYAFMASFDYLRELGSGSVLKTIYMPTIESFHISAPPLDEQVRIAGQLRHQLREARQLRTQLAERQSLIERLPQRILAGAFDAAD